MIRFTGITFSPNFADNAEKKFERTQKYIDSEVLRLSEPYVPKRTGKLIESGISGTVIGSGVVEYTAPYAKEQYYTNAGRGMDGLNAAHSAKGLRGAFPFERMKADHGDEIIEGAKKIE